MSWCTGREKKMHKNNKNKDASEDRVLVLNISDWNEWNNIIYRKMKFNEYLLDIAESFGEKYDDRYPRSKNTPSLRDVARQWGISIPKARQLLITSGLYSTNMSRKVKIMHENGMEIAEIAKKLHISTSSVSCYLPYKMHAYGMSAEIKKTDESRKYRLRKRAIIQLNEDKSKESLLHALRVFEGYHFGRGFSEKALYYIEAKGKAGDRIIFVEGDREISSELEYVVSLFLNLNSGKRIFNDNDVLRKIKIVFKHFGYEMKNNG